ncbi:MAG: hypothetical protein U9P80_09410, partial [Thermodesulfobacteriota bacterium]|nr:hypothetical protein [Thermodesulfobacteriota bacterium]
MKKYSVILCMAMFLVSMPLMAGQYVADADSLYEIGGLESCKKAVSLYEKAPGSYESDWKCARACQCAGDAAKDMGSSGWKEETAAYGKKGMEYAAKAIELNPNRVEGHY